MNRTQIIDAQFKRWELQRKTTYSPLEQRTTAEHVAGSEVVNREVYLDTKPLVLVDPGTVRPVMPPRSPDIAA